MADFSWNTQSPLERALVPGHHGVTGTQVGVMLEEVRDISLVQVMARRGKVVETVKAAKKVFGVEPPSTPGTAAGRYATLIWSGPDQFIAFSARSEENHFSKLSDAFAGVASLSDQSDGRCLIRIGGPRVRQALAKFCSLDLDDRAFPSGAAATTSIDHTATNIWREVDGADGHAVFHILVFTSFADSLWHTIQDAAVEYGVQASLAHAA
ncbi:sarcosine oxidase subunit gamma family protein [Mesorhizobium sp. VK22B]|uniref:Sarcosine oxidase subunit gamma family protein n=1 Tax=Mesorhizobium captivum TaxID=3072319 RepID=A0ABU4Z248_9HYPH|nr:sarcosine oxidase subunit gamma family protein [Mesorhizobium sp. VK22B]MDX8493128.1 sarcosine oxidase subunit gamma family protein [Mesorhizobium sp. VK22B]